MSNNENRLEWAIEADPEFQELLNDSMFETADSVAAQRLLKKLKNIADLEFEVGDFEVTFEQVGADTIVLLESVEAGVTVRMWISLKPVLNFDELTGE